MPNGYRNGAYAIGLISGIGLTLNLVFWLDYRAQDQKHQYSKGDDATQYSPIGQYWDGFIGTFVSPSDTLAQWTMAFFTIAATGVLVLTLRSANKTNLAAIKASNAALEANKIMRREARPWLDFSVNENCRIGRAGPNTLVISNLDPKVKNFGKSPAVKAWLCVKAIKSNLAIEEEIEFKALLNNSLRGLKAGKTVFPGECEKIFPGVHGFEEDVRIDPARDKKFATTDWLILVLRYRISGSDEQFWTGKLYSCAIGEIGKDNRSAADISEIELVSEYR